MTIFSFEEAKNGGDAARRRVFLTNSKGKRGDQNREVIISSLLIYQI
jgi:hypothetical protein